MRGKWRRDEVVAPGLRSARRQRVGIDLDGRAAFPEGEHAAANLDHRGIRGIDVIVVANRRRVLDSRAGGRHLESPRCLLAPELAGGDHARAVDHLAAADAPRSHQSIAIEPMRVTSAGAIEPTGSVAIQRPGELGGPSALEGRDGGTGGVASECLPPGEPGMCRHLGPQPPGRATGDCAGQQGLQEGPPLQRVHRSCTVTAVGVSLTSNFASLKCARRITGGLLLNPYPSVGTPMRFMSSLPLSFSSCSTCTA
jgi:hypothetical protein